MHLDPSLEVIIAISHPQLGMIRSMVWIKMHDRCYHIWSMCYDVQYNLVTSGPYNLSFVICNCDEM